jgi:hypothetical protein
MSKLFSFLKENRDFESRIIYNSIKINIIAEILYKQLNTNSSQIGMLFPDIDETLDNFTKLSSRKDKVFRYNNKRMIQKLYPKGAEFPSPLRKN